MQAPLAFAPDGSVAVQYPKDAVAASIAAPTAQWTYPATFSQIVASTPNPFVLCGVVLCISAGVTLDGAVELAEGAASSEVVFERFGYSGWLNVASGSATLVATHAQPLAPRYIASGTRLSIRQAQSLASGWVGGRLFVYGFDAPSPFIAGRIIDYIQYMQGHTTKGGDRLPTTDFVTLTHSGTAWTQGAWVQLAASLAEDALVEGLHILGVTLTRDFAVSCGVGGAGSEVALPGQLPIPGLTSPLVAGHGYVPFPVPMFVPKGSRLCARHKATNVTGTCKVAAKVSYLR